MCDPRAKTEAPVYYVVYRIPQANDRKARVDKERPGNAKQAVAGLFVRLCPCHIHSNILKDKTPKVKVFPAT